MENIYPRRTIGTLKIVFTLNKFRIVFYQNFHFRTRPPPSHIEHNISRPKGHFLDLTTQQYKMGQIYSKNLALNYEQLSIDNNVNLYKACLK